MWWPSYVIVEQLWIDWRARCLIKSSFFFCGSFVLQWIVSNPFSLSANRTPPYLLCNCIWRKMLLIWNNQDITKYLWVQEKFHLINDIIVKMTKVWILGKLSLLWSIFMANRADIIGIGSIPEFRYRSLLYPPFKKTACYYFFPIILAFHPKIWLSKWPWSLKVGLRGVKSKK